MKREDFLNMRLRDTKYKMEIHIEILLQWDLGILIIFQRNISGKMLKKNISWYDLNRLCFALDRNDLLSEVGEVKFIYFGWGIANRNCITLIKLFFLKKINLTWPGLIWLQMGNKGQHIFSFSILLMKDKFSYSGKFGF